MKNAEKTAATKYALSKFWLKYGSQAAKATSPAGIAPRIIRPMEATPYSFVRSVPFGVILNANAPIGTSKAV